MRQWHFLFLFPLGLSIFTQAQTQAPAAAHAIPANPNPVVLAGKNLTREGNVIAPFRYGDKVYFTATVPKKSGIGKVSRLFSAIRDEPAIPQQINPKEEDTNAANASLNMAGDRIYYTVFKETAPGKQSQSEIWYRDKQYDGTWGHVVLLPKHINQSNVITTQPTCGYDYKLKKEVLCFSSNRPGGKGGFDIWCCTVERDGTFGTPSNMAFNTASDEVTPFYYTQFRMLLFSSNMLGGKGGYDVYRSEKTESGTWMPAENLGSVNTTFDEIYFSHHAPSQTSYFCSNRPNANCQDNPQGCPNYSIFIGKLSGSLYLTTMIERDSIPLYGCNIELENMETGNIDTTILQSESSSVELPMLPEKKYRLIVSRQGYYPIFLPLDSLIPDFARPNRKTVYLRPMR